jgi:iron complex transport system substrate-binding protein
VEFFVALLAALLVGCRAAPAPASASAIVLTDDAARTVTLAAPAQRVVSLVPSATDAIVALGVRERLVGRTRYDRDPSLAAVTDVGGGLDPNIETIAGLRPDLVVLWSGDRRGDLRERLDALGIPTLALASHDTTDAFRGLALLGRALGRDSAATALADTVRAQFRAVIASRAGQPRPRAFYVVFNDPPMTASPRTFVGQLLDIAGATNIFADAEQDWPTIAMEELVRRAPDVVVLPTGELGEATLAKLRAQPGWRSLAAVRQGRVALVDGDLVNRPGPQMGRAAAALRDAMQQVAP